MKETRQEASINTQTHTLWAMFTGSRQRKWWPLLLASYRTSKNERTDDRTWHLTLPFTWRASCPGLDWTYGLLSSAKHDILLYGYKVKQQTTIHVEGGAAAAGHSNGRYNTKLFSFTVWVYGVGKECLSVRRRFPF